MKRKAMLLIFIILSTQLLTGCWDKMEINERGFPLIIGIDKLEGDEKENELDRIKVSTRVPNVGLISGKSPLVTETSFYYEEKGSNLASIIERITSKAPFSITLDHTKVIVFGKSLLEDCNLVREALDAIERESSFSRKVLLLGAHEDASQIVKIEPKEYPLIGMYLKGILDLEMRDGRAVDGTLNRIMYQIHEDGSSIWPYIKANKDNTGAELAGAYVLKDNKLMGSLDNREVSRFNSMIKGNKELGDVDIIYKGTLVSYEVYNTKQKLSVEEKNDNLILNIELESEGDIVQHKIGIRGFTLDDEAIKEMEKMIEKKLMSRLESVVEKLQKEYGVDVFGVKRYIRKFNPKLYKKIADDFDEYYSSMKVNIKIDAKIRRIGIVR
ncbi:Ger(x)C family spore germination protein [Alkalithermobacter paradoxus]|uniref:Spore germination protein A3 n=1 Tax=Alkalithermobacter paradoxus TaxID=29349 RepID=A0A1V4I5F4_9FIRM|nr:spore germination protein A3 precursor [[Clostridium] thermoalcaliphilum]